MSAQAEAAVIDQKTRDTRPIYYDGRDLLRNIHLTAGRAAWDACQALRARITTPSADEDLLRDLEDARKRASAAEAKLAAVSAVLDGGRPA